VNTSEKVKTSATVVKISLSPKEIEKIDSTIDAGYALSRSDICRQALHRYLSTIDRLQSSRDIDVDNPRYVKADSFHAYADHRDGCYRCDITNAICERIGTAGDCRMCIVPFIEKIGDSIDNDSKKA
jgi:hypothetical protein